MARKVTIHTTMRDADDPETIIDTDEDTYGHDRARYGRNPVAFAVQVIRDNSCDSEPSSYPNWGGPHTWYSAETYVHPYTGAREEKSAHLDGFSDEESREVYRQITGR